MMKGKTKITINTVRTVRKIAKGKRHEKRGKKREEKKNPANGVFQRNFINNYNLIHLRLVVIRYSVVIHNFES